MATVARRVSGFFVGRGVWEPGALFSSVAEIR